MGYAQQFWLGPQWGEAGQYEIRSLSSPILYGSVQNYFAEWTTLAIDDILGGNETIESLQDLALDYEYLRGRPAFLHSGWFLEGLRTY